MRKFSRPSLLAMIVAAFAAPAAAQQAVTPSQISGRLHVYFADPITPGGKGTISTYVFDERTGRMLPIQLDSAIAAPFGGISAMSQRRVDVSLNASRRVTRVNSVTKIDATIGTGGALTPVNDPGSSVLMGVPQKSTTGLKRYAVLTCKFTDTPTDPTWPVSHLADMLTGSGTRTVKKLWEETSAGQVQVTTPQVATSWKTLPHERTFYVHNENNADAPELQRDCMAAHDAEFDFSQFEGVILQFNASIGCCSIGAIGNTTLDGPARAMPGVWDGFDPSIDPSPFVGIFAHEMGHNFGLFHSRVPDAAAYSSQWDIMSTNTLYSEGGVTFGAQTLAVQKDYINWIPASRRFVATDPSSTITIERNALPGANANYLLAIVPIGANNYHYYAVELRKKVGFDVAVPGEGVVIHEWDGRRFEPAWVVDVDGNRDANDAGAIWVAGETFYDPKNSIAITVNSIGASSASVTIRNNGGVAFGLSATGGKRELVSGTSAIDSVQVQMSGGPGATIPWTASRPIISFVNVPFGRSSWASILNASGAGTAQMRIRHDATGMGPGTYVDSITITSPAFYYPIKYYDTLVVTPAAGLSIGLSLRSRSDSTIGTRVFSFDSVAVLVTGTGASTAQWTARAKHNWIEFNGANSQTLNVENGTGSRTLYWNRFSSRLSVPGAPGIYVDTITVTLAAGPSATMIDTFVVDPAVHYTLPIRGRTFTAPEGAQPVRDSLLVTFNAPFNTKGEVFLKTLSPRSVAERFDVPVPNYDYQTDGVFIWRHVGNGYVYYTRGNPDLPAGTYIDTLTLVGPWGGLLSHPDNPPGMEFSQRIIDTLIITSAAKSISVFPASRRDTIVAGMSDSKDSVFVTILGPNQNSVLWLATARQGVVVLENPSGTIGADNGSRWMHYTRNTGRAPGVYVDTVDFSTNLPVVTTSFIDTLVVLPSGGMMASATARKRSVATATAAVVDTVGIDVFGSASVAWTATKKGAWNTFTNSSGTGSGAVRWKRSPNGLALGTYVDTITVTSAGGFRGFSLIDSFTVSAPTAFMTPRITPDSSGALTGANVSATLSLDLSATGGTLGSYSGSVTWNSAVLALDSVRAVTGGFAAPVLGVTAAGSAAISATDATGKTGNVGLAKFWFHVIGAIATQSTITPSITSAFSNDVEPIDYKLAVATAVNGKVGVLGTVMSLSALSRRGAAIAGEAPLSDSLDVQFQGSAAASTPWTAVKKSGWTTLTTSSGTGPGKLRWTRSASVLAAGIYVDTITVSGTDVQTQMVIDTFTVSAPTVFATAALSPDSSGGVIGLEMPATLSLNLGAIAKSLGSYTATVKWDSTVVRLDSAVAVAGGFAGPTVTINNAGQITLTATDGTGKTGVVSLARLHFRMVADVTGTQSALTPAFTAAASIPSQQTNLLPSITTTAGKVAVIPGALRGDVNLDGRITMADAQAIVRAAAKVSATGIRATPNGDVNCDGKVTAIDAQIVLRRLVGLPVASFCVGTIK